MKIPVGKGWLCRRKNLNSAPKACVKSCVWCRVPNWKPDVTPDRPHLLLHGSTDLWFPSHCWLYRHHVGLYTSNPISLLTIISPQNLPLLRHISHKAVTAVHWKRFQFVLTGFSSYSYCNTLFHKLEIHFTYCIYIHPHSVYFYEIC